MVPVFNVERYIDCCIKSLLNQDFKGNLEIIVVDDGSTDNSLDILNRYAELSPERLKVLHKENGGQSSARNLAMECARGEYISFVDSDDYVEPGFISNLYNLAVSSDADIAMCSIGAWKMMGKENASIADLQKIS